MNAVIGIVIVGAITSVLILTMEPDDNGDGNGNDYSWATDPNRLTMPETRENLTLIVDYKNGTIDEFEDIDLFDHYTTCFDLLNKCCRIDYKTYNWQPKSFFIEEINGLSGDWVYEVNDESIPAAANVVSPPNDSVVFWEYIS